MSKNYLQKHFLKHINEIYNAFQDYFKILFDQANMWRDKFTLVRLHMIYTIDLAIILQHPVFQYKL